MLPGLLVKYKVDEVVNGATEELDRELKLVAFAVSLGSSVAVAR